MGGRWDANDDCCEPKCTEETPCAEGEGNCFGNETCHEVRFMFKTAFIQ